MVRPALGGGLVGDALDLGLLGGLPSNHGLDVLDRLADLADLVAAGCFPDVGVDLALSHALQDRDQACEGPCEAEVNENECYA